ncbi:MAG: hypothetical protein JSU68_12020, partial [Phycisphaerales bacterium]
MRLEAAQAPVVPQDANQSPGSVGASPVDRDDCNGNSIPDDLEAPITIYRALGTTTDVWSMGPYAQDLHMDTPSAVLHGFSIAYQSSAFSTASMAVRFYLNDAGNTLPPAPAGLIAEYAGIGPLLPGIPEGIATFDIPSPIAVPPDLWIEVYAPSTVHVALAATPPTIGSSSGTIVLVPLGLPVYSGYFRTELEAVSCESDCNANEIPDGCDLDCGPPGGLCDLPDCGLSEDCQPNGIPDECDIAGGTSSDCNDNMIPDECDVAVRTLLVTLGVRETGSTEPIGSDGGTLGSLEWLNLDGQTLDMDGTWQLFTWDLDADPVAGFSGNGVLDGDAGTFEHLRFRSTGFAGPFTLHIDEVVDTVTTLGPVSITGFEGYADDEEVMFKYPGYSGTTHGYIALGSTAGVDNITSYAGSASNKVEFSFLLDDPGWWLRLTTYNATNVPNPTIAFDDDSVVTTWIRGARPGYSPDCNGNLAPDECDLFGGTSADCNGNLVPDECDIAEGTSDDCQPNGVPDECDLAYGTSNDVNGNSIPDECDPDCNLNGVPDDYDILMGTSDDCQPNGSPDECDIAGGTSLDCDYDDVPDECEDMSVLYFAQGTIYDALLIFPPVAQDLHLESSAGAVLRSFTIGYTSYDTGMPMIARFHVNDPYNSVPPPYTGLIAEYFGFPLQFGGPHEFTFTPDPPLQLPPDIWLEVGTLLAAPTFIALSSSPPSTGSSEGWIVDATSGLPISPPLSYWFDVEFEGFPCQEDCNGNEIADPCDLDCGPPDGPCDVPGCGLSEDCNGNDVPDECDLSGWTSDDCNTNSVPDECDIIGGTSDDCQPNGIPDECEEDCQPNGIPDDCDIIEGTSYDCQNNYVPDECDIAGGSSADCQPNNVPDECEEDCQPNGVPDDCDIIGGTSDDCNANSVPDECDVAGLTSEDCNGTTVPDECDIASGTSVDCQPNGIPDDCDIIGGTSDDCNANGVPDECDIAGGTSADCQPNGIPDECDIAGPTSEDCNGNAVPDECDIGLGTSLDCQPNDIPDECDLADCPPADPDCQDCNSNSIPDRCDIASGT